MRLGLGVPFTNRLEVEVCSMVGSANEFCVVIGVVLVISKAFGLGVPFANRFEV